MDGKLKGKVPLKDIAPSKDDPPTLVLTPGMRRREIKIDAAPPSPHVKKDVRLDAAPQGSPSVRKKEFKIGDTVPSPGLKRKGVEPVPLSPALRKKEVNRENPIRFGMVPFGPHLSWSRYQPLHFLHLPLPLPLLSSARNLQTS